MRKMKADEFRELIESGKLAYDKKGNLVTNKGLKSKPLTNTPKKRGTSKKTQEEKQKKREEPFSVKKHFELVEKQKELIKQLSGTYVFDVIPVPKPRMTQADKWKKRDSVNRYYAFKDQLVDKGKLMGLTSLPMEIKRIRYVIPMSKSWSKRDKQAMENQLHLIRPDTDNLRKALQDALCDEDSHIARVGLEEKIWGKEGKIIIEI